MEVAVPSHVLSCGSLRSSGSVGSPRGTLSYASPAPSCSCSSSSCGVSARASFSTASVGHFLGGSVSGEHRGQRLRIPSPNPSVSPFVGKRGVVTMGGEKLGYETEAFVIYDVMRYVKPPIFTLCVGNAWEEAALLFAAGARGNRAAQPPSTIMIKQPIARFQGQATDIELARKEVRNVKAELVKPLSRLRWISDGQNTSAPLKLLNMASSIRYCTMKGAEKIKV